ncbi:MAG: hypothetical protein HY905_08190 [Deltaproteobacteria bacterium]|nr:hypothetical protein [Deltaproteobacteria bacterium]
MSALDGGDKAGKGAVPGPDADASLESFEIRPSRASKLAEPLVENLVVGGELVRRRAGAGWTTLRVLFHLSLLFVPWFVLHTMARFFVGYRRRGTLRLAADGLVLRRECSILGRKMREEEISYPLAGLAAVGRVKRYRWLHLLVGLLCLVVGGSVGIIAIHDGIAGGYAPLALGGFGLLALGVVIDLALNVLVPAARRRSVVEVRLPREDLWLSGVEDDLADVFVRAVRGGAAEARAARRSGGA